MALAQEPRTIEQLCDLVRPVPSRVKAAPFGHDNSFGHYGDGTLPTRALVLARVSGWLADRVHEYLYHELRRHTIIADDLGARAMDELMYRAVRHVHEDDMLPREAARAAVRWLLDLREQVAEHTGYWGGIYGV